jgi:hypothetical protein
MAGRSPRGNAGVNRKGGRDGEIDRLRHPRLGRFRGSARRRRTNGDRLDARLVLANVVEYLLSPHAAARGIGPGAVARAPLTATLEEQLRAGERLLEQLADQAGVEQAEPRVVSGFAAERLAD